MNIEDINITDDDIIFNMTLYNNDLNSFNQIMDNIRNITHILNTNDIGEVVYFNIEIIHNNQSENQSEDKNYFKSCKDINEKICKSIKIKKNDQLLESNCLICIEDFKEGEYKRELPKCHHVYHKKCIDKWLKKSATCPVCRDVLL